MINIKNNRELFTDDYLIDTTRTTARIASCKPVKREVVFVHDAPWENRGTVYHNILRKPDGTYLMYHKADYNNEQPDGSFVRVRRICVLTSDDGINWVRPQLSKTPLTGNPNAPVNNIVTLPCHTFDNLFVFYDTNPECPENERYKAIYGEWHNGLYCYKSADGINFDYFPESKDTLIMTSDEGQCYFDSLNTMYYNSETGKYIAFVRGIHLGDDLYPSNPDDPRVIRDIRYMESVDFKHWTHPARVDYCDNYDYQMYTNSISPYYRAPGLWIAMPTRYVGRDRWTDSFEKLPFPEDRKNRGRGLSLNDAIFMSSRDCKRWYRFSEAFFTPGPEQKMNWAYGDCYVCLGMVETPNSIKGADPYLTLFCKEGQEDAPTKLYGYTLRIDGFVEVRGDFDGKKLVTKPFTFEGSEMEINFSTSAIGYVKIKLISENKTLETDEIIGDKIDRTVGFINGTAGELAGKEVIMEIELKDSAIYSFKFN